MKTTIGLLSLVLLSASCATSAQNPRAPVTGAKVTERRVDGPTIVSPPMAPEADPENVERRFGFAQAKARREQEAAAKAHAGHGQVDLVPGGGSTPAAAPADAGHAGHSAAAAGAVAKPGTHDHGSSGAANGKADLRCPCMKDSQPPAAK